jgi:hypothetical protein
MKVMWALWTFSGALLVLWLSALFYQVPVHPASHLFLIVSFVTMIGCALYGFRYCGFGESNFMKRVEGSSPHPNNDVVLATEKADAYGDEIPDGSARKVETTEMNSRSVDESNG